MSRILLWVIFRQPRELRNTACSICTSDGLHGETLTAAAEVWFWRQLFPRFKIAKKKNHVSPTHRSRHCVRRREIHISRQQSVGTALTCLLCVAFLLCPRYLPPNAIVISKPRVRHDHPSGETSVNTLFAPRQRLETETHCHIAYKQRGGAGGKSVSMRKTVKLHC